MSQLCLDKQRLGSANLTAGFDPYSFTHLLHGFMFAGLLTLLMKHVDDVAFRHRYCNRMPGR